MLVLLQENNGFHLCAYRHILYFVLTFSYLFPSSLLPGGPSYRLFFKNKVYWGCFRTLVALADDLGLIPNTHEVAQPSVIPVLEDCSPSFDLEVR